MGGAFSHSWSTQVGRFRPVANGRPAPSKDRWHELVAGGRPAVRSTPRPRVHLACTPLDELPQK